MLSGQVVGMMQKRNKGPFIHIGNSNLRFAVIQILALLPAALWGVFRYGMDAFLVLAAAVAGACVTSIVIERLQKQSAHTIMHAALAGFLVGMCLPATVPLYLPLVSAAAGVIIASRLTGSTGSGWLHPALAGLAVALLSWPEIMKIVSPLSGWYELAAQGGTAGVTPSDTAGAFSISAYPVISSEVHRVVSELSGLSIPEHITVSALGLANGAIGQSSPLLLLAGSVFLFARKITDWGISALSFAVFAVLGWLFNGLAWGTGFAGGDVLFFVLNGPYLLVTLFMLQYYGSIPMSLKGRMAFGAVSGVFAWLFMLFGTSEYGMIVALFATLVVSPFIDAKTRRSALSRSVVS